MTITLARPSVGSALSSAKNIYVSACAAELADAPELLQRHSPSSAIATGIFSPIINHRSYADPETGRRVRSFFLTRELKKHLTLGLVEYCPWRYRNIDRWLSSADRFDTAMVMLSPPDANGECSLGVQTDFLPSFAGRVENLLGFINPRMPRTTGDASISYRALASVVDYDVALPTMAQRPADDVSAAIAEQIAAIVPDRATVQFGLGQIPSQVIARLSGHHEIRVHSGVVDDNILILEKSGALDRSVPIVTGTAVGTASFYDALSKNDRFSFRAVRHTHSHRVISSIKLFTAINSVLQVDLFGQSSAEGSGGKLVASPGGLPDFARGALDSDGGTSIIAVRAVSQPGHSPGIVALLDMPHAVTGTAGDADVIVTEYGVARVRNLSMDARAEAIIAIADPKDRAALTEAWASMRGGLIGGRARP